MQKRKILAPVMVLLLALMWAGTALAQQPEQPLTFWYDYTVREGKEEDFMTLVRTVGEPVRDRLMAEGVVLAWGVEVPLLRGLYPATHTIWFAVADWSGTEKVHKAMDARLAELAAEEAAAAGARRGPRPAMTTAERAQATFDSSKTRDWVTRDLVIVVGNNIPAGVLPFTRYNGFKVRPGKGGAFREYWDKYNKPVLDRLVADGTVLAFGLAAEELKTTNDFTHFVWIATKSLADHDKVRAAFIADRARRSAEERSALSAAFAEAVDSEASRSAMARSIIFKVGAPPPR